MATYKKGEKYIQYMSGFDSEEEAWDWINSYGSERQFYVSKGFTWEAKVNKVDDRWTAQWEAEFNE